MNKENTKYLLNRFPFLKPRDPLAEDPKGIGFRCGDGWFELVKKLSEDLEVLGADDLEVTTVKQKCGGLRFIIEPKITDLPKFKKIIELSTKAYEESFKVCEQCGRPGMPRAGKGVRTLCDECHNEEKNAG